MTLQELEITTESGTRIYSEYRPNGRGGRVLIGFLVDNGRDRQQVATMADAKQLATVMDDAR